MHGLIIGIVLKDQGVMNLYLWYCLRNTVSNQRCLGSYLFRKTYLDPMLTNIVHTPGVIVHAKKPVWFFTSPYCSSTLLFSLSLEYSMYGMSCKICSSNSKSVFCLNLLILQYLSCNVLLKVFIFFTYFTKYFFFREFKPKKRKSC